MKKRQKRLEEKIQENVIQEIMSDDPVKEALEFHFRVIAELFSDESVTDLAINPDGRVFLKHIGKPKEEVELPVSMDSLKAVALLLASRTQNDITDRNPSVDSAWEDPPLRIHISLPPAVSNPCLSVRRFSSKVFTLDDYVEAGSCSAEDAERLRAFVVGRKNIIVSGETGSGKTTLLNALLAEIPPRERVFLIEDTNELQCDLPDLSPIYFGDRYTARMAIKDVLRQDPDRIIVGEVRDGAALDMLQGWNTGHPGGLASIHANSVDAVKLRLKSLVEQASYTPQDALIEEAVDVAVQMAVDPDGKRRIAAIKEFRK